LFRNKFTGRTKLLIDQFRDEMITPRLPGSHTHDSRRACFTERSHMRIPILLLTGVIVAACTPVKSSPPLTASVSHPAAVSGPQGFAYLKAFSNSNVRDGCPPQGDAKPDSVKALNILKNRVIPPQEDEYDTSVTLSALLQRGDDEDRWDEAKGGVLVGFVHDAKVGGIETTNCKATDAADRDTHIELVLSQAKDGPTKRVIVEVTPRWRDKMQSQGVDWSTPALNKSIKGKWVRVKGWLLFDLEHENQSENTSPGNDKNWRATAWEIHPVTEIDVLPGRPN
jgi:hypothetical protein